jgi:hypothetical protein
VLVPLVRPVRRSQVVQVGKYHRMRDVHAVHGMAGGANGMKRHAWPANKAIASVSCSAACLQNPELFCTPHSGRHSGPQESNKAVYRQYPFTAGCAWPADRFHRQIADHQSVADIRPDGLA